MLAGHLVETEFGFGVTTTSTLFWLALALLASAPAWAAIPESAPGSAASVGNAVMKSGRAGGLGRAALAILLVAVVPAVGVRLLIADQLAATAEQSAAAADLPAGIRDLERAAALWPSQPAYRETLSWYHLQLALNGRQADAHFRAAEAALRGAVLLAPGDYRLQAAFGELYTEWGRAGDPARFPQAETSYRRAVAMFPGSAALHTGWGLCYVAQGRTAEAARQFALATGLDQTDARAYAYLGDAVVLLGDLRGAEQAYRSALRWDPGLAGPRAALADMQVDSGRAVSAGAGVHD
jgi:Tfp pilus assembly protein PilF